jgi:hypothetical protein
MSEEKRYVISDQPKGDAPRLMAICDQRLSMEALHRIKTWLDDGNNYNRNMVFEGGLRLFQLIEGRWLEIGVNVDLEDVPVPEKINFREFL